VCRFPSESNLSDNKVLRELIILNIHMLTDTGIRERDNTEIFDGRVSLYANDYGLVFGTCTVCRKRNFTIIAFNDSGFSWHPDHCKTERLLWLYRPSTERTEAVLLCAAARLLRSDSLLGPIAQRLCRILLRRRRFPRPTIQSVLIAYVLLNTGKAGLIPAKSLASALDPNGESR
jgi:hypothetical protein